MLLLSREVFVGFQESENCFDVGNSSKMNILTPVNQILDVYIIQMLTKIDALLKSVGDCLIITEL